MPRFRAPANVLLRRAQLSLVLATLLPTILMTALGIVILSLGGGASSIIYGILVIIFCTTSITGYVLGSIFVSKGASQARSQHDFLNSVSHELRTPLTSISMFIEALNDDRLTDEAEQKQCLQLLSTETRRLRRLVERLLSLSRLEAGQERIVREPVRVADVIEESIATFDAATLPNRITIDVVLDDPALEIPCDREALAQALSNLLVNAWKYSDREPKIELRVSADDKHVEISVTDHGRGIPKEEQRHIFERFERGTSAIDGAPGSGLGLAIVRAVVRAHKGKIEVRSKVGEGSEFRLRLRRHA